MKPSRLLIFPLTCLAIFTSLRAQITITMSDAQSIFAAGKYWRDITDTSQTTLDVKIASSSAQTWVWPTFVSRDTTRLDNVSPASTTYASNFPNATHAQRATITFEGLGIITFYVYWRIANDSLISLGSVTVIPGFPDQITTRNVLEAKFPLTLNSSFTSRDSISLGGGSYRIEKASQTIDAFGSIALPAGTFQALRLKTQTISENYSGGVLGSRDTSVGFTWFTKDSYLAGAGAQYAYQTTGIIPVNNVSYTAILTSTGVANASRSLPDRFELHQNYPNPFNPSTAIEYNLVGAGYTRLIVYNLLGEEVAVLVDEIQSVGPHRVVFDAKGFPSGVYTYRMISGGATKSGRMMLLK